MTHLVYLEPLLFVPGDRLTLEDFLARWEQMPALRFAELIDGVVYLPSPVSIEHARRDGLLQFWAGLYASKAKVAEVLPNITWLMLKSAPQPDLSLRLKPEYGGQSWEEKELAAGAPEFAAEVSRSTRSYDLGPKLALYERAGVKEYLAALLEEQRLEWRVLREHGYELMRPDNEGIYRSEVFPGLWLGEAAFWNGDVAGVEAVLERGIQSDEFAEFRRRTLEGPIK
jgi:Uma2 family endonuclease